MRDATKCARADAALACRGTVDPSQGSWPTTPCSDVPIITEDHPAQGDAPRVISFVSGIHAAPTHIGDIPMPKPKEHQPSRLVSTGSDDIVPAGSGTDAMEMRDFEPLAAVELDSSANPAKWSTSQVADWLGKMQLFEHQQAFRQQRITGDVLEQLKEHHLKELGVNIIGERVSLMKAIAKLHHGAVNRQRFRIIWEDDEVRYRRGPAGYACDHLCCLPCCIDMDHYKLTGSTLVLIERDTKKHNDLCCRISRVTRNINLDSIASVTAVHASSPCDCGCAADEIHVNLDAELGLTVRSLLIPSAPFPCQPRRGARPHGEIPSDSFGSLRLPSPPLASQGVNPLKVKKGEGEKINKMIQSAIEDAQAMARTAPHGDSMARA